LLKDFWACPLFTKKPAVASTVDSPRTIILRQIYLDSGHTVP
jgi:hypothetical protein